MFSLPNYIIFPDDSRILRFATQSRAESSIGIQICVFVNVNILLLRCIVSRVQHFFIFYVFIFPRCKVGFGVFFCCVVSSSLNNPVLSAFGILCERNKQKKEEKQENNHTIRIAAFELLFDPFIFIQTTKAKESPKCCDLLQRIQKLKTTHSNTKNK